MHTEKMMSDWQLQEQTATEAEALGLVDKTHRDVYAAIHVKHVIPAEGDRPDEEKIARLFEQFLVRRPTPSEMAHAKGVVASGSEGWEDLQWLLVNKVEFVHNF